MKISQLSKFHATYLAATTCAALGLVAAPAAAIPLIGNLLPDGNVGTGINGPNSKAVGFVPDIDYNFDNAQLTLSAFDGSSDSPLVEILEGSSPSTADVTSRFLLETFEQDDPSLLPVQEQVFNFSHVVDSTDPDDMQFMLFAGVQYWLNVATSDTGSETFTWESNAPFVAPTGPAAFSSYQLSNDDATTHELSTQFNLFVINVTPKEVVAPPLTPVSGSGPVAILGFGILLATGSVRRRSRH